MMRRIGAGLFLTAMMTSAALASPTVTDIFPQTTVTKSNVGDFMTPLAYYNGALYEIDVEPPSTVAASTDNLLTVVHKGVPNSDGTWTWTSNTVETRTMNDAYHATGSIGVDELGYIHIAYNMHSSPWQYAVSQNPGDITNFVFKGEPVSLSQIDATLAGRSSYPDIGTATIPGNQITYPRFANDRKGKLYVSYRMALYPALANYFAENFGCGLAAYNASTQTWTPIGGPVPVSALQGRYTGTAFNYTSFAAAPNLWCVRFNLWFDTWNRMFTTWEWYDYTQPENGSPLLSFALSIDGGASFYDGRTHALTKPISTTAPSTLFQLPEGNELAPMVLSDPNNNPVIIGPDPAHPNGYRIQVLNLSNHVWSDIGLSPYNAPFVMPDSTNNLWAVASGPTVFFSPVSAWATSWKNVYQESGSWGYPFGIYAASAKALFVRIMSCPSTSPNCTIRILKITNS